MAKKTQSGKQAPGEVLVAEPGGEEALTRAREAADRSGDVMDGVLALIAQGYSQVRACKAMGVLAWDLFDRRKADAGFQARFDGAMEAQAAHWRDEIMDIADSEADPNRARVRVDSRRWLLSKLRPREYGDKQTVEHSGPGGSAIQHAVTVELVPSVAPAQLAREGGDQTGGDAA